MTHVFVTGLAVIDFVFQVGEMPTKAEKYKALGAAIIGGGGAANAAVVVSRLGGKASLGARIGRDHTGDMILADLQTEGVNLDCVHRGDSARSAFSSVFIANDGERQIVNFRGEGLIDEAKFLRFPENVDAALADTRWDAGTRKTMQIAKARGIPGVIDAEAPVGLDQLADASHIAFSRQGLTDLTGEADITKALKLASTMVSAWVCVTDGSAGVYVITGHQIENIPAFPVDAIDTLAAGDVWHGAFALRLAQGAGEHAAIEFANAAAALKCMHFGGRAGCPGRAEVERLLATSGRSAKPL